MDPKKQLADLMDAFAAAKASQNEMLQRLVLGQINAFFQTHEITPVPTDNGASASAPTSGTSWS